MRKMIGRLSAAATAVLVLAAGSAFAESFELRDGATAAGKIDEITARLTAAEKSVLLLDDEEIAVSEGGDTISATLSKPLTIGSHSAEIISINNGNAARSLYSFRVVSRDEKELINDDMSAAPAVADGKSDVNTDSVAGITEDGTEVKLSAAKVDGRDDDSAFAFICPIDRPSGSKGANAFITLKNLNWDKEITVEMDLFFSKPMRYGFEVKTAAGSWAFPFGANGDEPFKSDGTIKGTSYTYPVGEWFHMKATVDTVGGLGNMWINDELVIENFDHGTSLSAGVSTFKIQPVFEAASAGDMFAIDNLRVVTGNSIGGFETLSYRAEDGWANADGGIVPADTTRLLLTGTTGLEVGDITDKVTVYAGGYELAVRSAAVTADGVEIELAENIGEEKSARIAIDTESELGNELEYRFTSAVPQVAVKSVDFTMNNKKVITGHQLAAGKLMARGTLVNLSENEENVTVILAVYRDDKPVAFKAAQTKLTAGTKARRVQLTLDIPEGEGRLAAEYFMISSFDSRKPYSKVIAK